MAKYDSTDLNREKYKGYFVAFVDGRFGPKVVAKAKTIPSLTEKLKDFRGKQVPLIEYCGTEKNDD